MCGFFKFQKAYFDDLVDKKIIRVSCEEIEGVDEDGAEDSSALKDLRAEELEKNVEKMM